MTIAVAGKGGTGKTTVCGILIEYLSKKNDGAVLAVDADPNSNLNEVLGVELPATLGDIREQMLRGEADGGEVPAGMTKQEYAEFRFGDALVEGARYDMLVMGRTQGKGCYCFVNGVLKTQVDKHSAAYRYIVVDNEAGMEHISRGILPAIDVLLLLSDSSRRGVQAAGRIARMAEELKLNPGKVGLVVNRTPGGVPDPGVLEEVAAQKLELLGALPDDQAVYRYDCEGRPSSAVPEDSPVKQALRPIIEKLGL
ncbi:MAG: AAA family ATPase [Acidobacteriota bacterium]|jgi:CO dehydrogenase maturation factor|nr:AAA family ATPase [Acidobacteriota bacterium]